MWTMIATWRMAKEGVEQVVPLLNDCGEAGDAIELAIRSVEDFPFYKSVGFGGLPNEMMEVELDAAYMDGTSLSIGCVGAMKDVANPISVARKLSYEPVNNMLVGSGAERYAHQQGFERKNMLSDRAKKHYHNRLVTLKNTDISPYSGHDTVGMVCLDQARNIVAGTSTSGLFMKRQGRVGDSPIIGSGLYADALIGGATATGLGEDLMKGVVSYRVVALMEQGKTPQEACESVVFDLDERLTQLRGKAGDISIVAIDNKGNWGAASNIETFSFVVGTEEGVNVYQTQREGNVMRHTVASEEWLSQYLTERMQPLEDINERNHK